MLAKPEMLKTKIKVFRFDPSRDERPRYETFEVPYKKGARIYTTLMYIREELGVDLTFRHACRQRICGQCAVLINGTPRLICWEEPEPEMTIEPLPNFQVIKDLIIDRSQYDARIQHMRPYIEPLRIREIPKEIKPEDITIVPHEDSAGRDAVFPCIECLCCVSVCPAIDGGRFAGPAAINRLAMFAFDPRDKMSRMPTAFSEGVYDCTTCKQCEEVCPVNLAMPDRIEWTIEKLRALMASEGVGPLPEHLAFGDEAMKTGRVIVKYEKTLLELLPEEVKAK